MENGVINTKIELSEINKMTVFVDKENEADRYAYYIYKNDKVIEKVSYTNQNTNVYWVSEPGVYKIKVFVKNTQGNKKCTLTEEIHFDGLRPIICSETNTTDHFKWIKNVVTIAKEIWQNRKRMIRLSFYDYALANKDSYLGRLWSILNPLIQIGTYWFVFGIGIRNNKPVGGHAFLPWMLCGLMPWFFFSYCIVNGASSIYAKSGTVFKLKYPVSTIPMGAIFVGFYNHLVVLAMLVISLIFFGYYPNIYWLNLIYYLLYEFVFLTSFSMITSVLTMIARDFQKLLSSLIRLWFYLTPILWSMDNLPQWVQTILKLNPALYIVNGFRDSLIYGNMFFVHTNKIIFFWSLNVVLIIVGCNLQMKFRNKFIDML